MSYQLNNIGEEFLARMALRRDTIAVPASLTLGLYLEATDLLTETDDLAAITTEPADGNYARRTITIDNADIILSKVGGNWQMELSENGINLVFDVIGTTGSVDAWFVVATFQSTEAGDAVPTAHLIANGALSATYNLSLLDTLNVSNAALSLN